MPRYRKDNSTFRSMRRAFNIPEFESRRHPEAVRGSLCVPERVWSDVAYESANHDLALSSEPLAGNRRSDSARCIARSFGSGAGFGDSRAASICHLDISVTHGATAYALALSATSGLLAGLEDVLEGLVEFSRHFGRFSWLRMCSLIGLNCWLREVDYQEEALEPPLLD